MTLHNESPKSFWQDGTSGVFELAQNVIQSTIREIYMDRAEAEQFLFFGSAEHDAPAVEGPCEWPAIDSNV